MIPVNQLKIGPSQQFSWYALDHHIDSTLRKAVDLAYNILVNTQLEGKFVLAVLTDNIALLVLHRGTSTTSSKWVIITDLFFKFPFISMVTTN